MDTNLIQQIHRSPSRLAMVVTGGGSHALSDLLIVPGASGTVLEASIPYSALALADYLKTTPERYCDEATARMMAMRAFVRAMQLNVRQHAPGDESLLLGVGCTASLASEPPKRGEHRAHVAIQTADRTQVLTLQLKKGGRDRAGEERLLADIILAEIAAACGIEVPASATGDADWQVTRDAANADPGWREVLLGQRQAVAARGTGGAEQISEVASDEGSDEDDEGADEDGGEWADDDGEPLAVLPGAFHPLHRGHRRMAEYGSRWLGSPVVYELTIANVDKPPLDYIDVRQRLAQFRPNERVWLTRTPTFVEKSENFTDATFLVGADTIERIGQSRYYGNDPAARDAAFQEIEENGCRFLVFGRLQDGSFRTLRELQLPEALRELCDEVPAEQFREDVSSTDIRHPGRDKEE